MLLEKDSKIKEASHKKKKKKKKKEVQFSVWRVESNFPYSFLILKLMPKKRTGYIGLAIGRHKDRSSV
jgi:hypothetical protein